MGAKSDDLRRAFLNAAQPILAGMMRDANAAMIIERRAVFLSADVIDITDEAIARIDAAIGDGASLEGGSVANPALPADGAVDNQTQQSAPVPQPAPDPQPQQEQK